MDEQAAINKFVRVDPADPTRCQSNGQNGEQCPFQGYPKPAGGFFNRCFMHGGTPQAANMKRRTLQLYHVQKYRERIDGLSDPEVSGTLTEELGILRMLLENMLNKANEVELVTQASQMSKLIVDIKELLVADKKLKSAMGQLLDKAILNKVCDGMVEIIAKHVPPQALDRVSEEVSEMLATIIANRLEL